MKYEMIPLICFKAVIAQNFQDPILGLKKLYNFLSKSFRISILAEYDSVQYLVYGFSEKILSKQITKKIKVEIGIVENLILQQ